MGNEKRFRLSLNKDFVRIMENGLARFPLLSDGVSGNVEADFGGAIKRYCALFPASEQDGRFWRRISKCGNRYLGVTCPLGRNTIKKRIRGAFKLLGIERWDNLWSHSLRAQFATKIANDNNISDAERLASCRHSNVQTNAKYQQRGLVSEAARLNCLIGEVKPPSKPSPVKLPPYPTYKAPTKPKSVPSSAEKLPAVSSPVAKLQSPVAVVPATHTPAPTSVVKAHTNYSPTYMSPVDIHTSTSSTASYTSSYSSATKHSHRENAYSIYTQMEETKLYEEMLECEQRLLERDNKKRPAMSDRQRQFCELRMRIKCLEAASRTILSPYKNNNHEYETLVSESITHDMEIDKERRRQQYWCDKQHFEHFEVANRRARDRKRKRKSDPSNDRNFGKDNLDEYRRFSH